MLASPTSFDLSAMSVADLLRLWAGTMSELQHRHIVRTNNNPIGDIAEAIVHRHFGGERGAFSQKGWDIRTETGQRLQVKAMRRTGSRARRNLSAIRDTEYDSVVVVMFDIDFNLTLGLQFRRELVEQLFPMRSHVNGRIITITDSLMQHPDVIQLDLSNAYAEVSSPPT